MADIPGWVSEPVNPSPRSPVKRRGDVVLIASLAIMTWIGWKFWDTPIVESARLKIWNTFVGNDSIRLLRSGRGSLEDRILAVRDLGHVDRDDEIDDAIATLIATLDDQDAQVRAKAAQSLGALVYETQHRGREKPGVAQQMNRWTEAATRALVKGLSDHDPEFRMAVCAGLQMMKPELPSWHRSPPAQLSAAVKLGTVKWNRTTAKEYWGFVDEVPPPELVAALKDESLPVRMAATQALARFHLGLDSAIPTLFAMLDDPESTIRRAAERTLGAAWPTPVVVPTLIEALRSKNQAVRYGSVQMLNRIEIESNANEAVPLLTAILKEPPRSTPDPDMTVVFGFSNDRSPTRGAAIALGRIAPNETTVKLFIEILSTGKPDEPGVAQRWIDSAEGLLQVGPNAVTAVPALTSALDQLLDSKKPMPGLYPLVDAIGRLAPDSSSAVGAVDVLTRLLEPKYQAWYPDARSLAIEFLGRFGRLATVAIPKLRALQRENDAVGTAAAAALAAIEADLKRNPLRGHSR